MSRDHDRRAFQRLRDRLFDDLARWPDLVDASGRATPPAAAVEESRDGWVVTVDLPGVRPDDLTVEVDGGRLVVDGLRRWAERAGPDPGPRGRARLELTLPSDVDSDAVTATLDDGVARIRLPRATSAARQRIPVERRAR